MLYARWFSSRTNKKTIEEKSHPDQDTPLASLTTGRQFEQQGHAMISVDCEKEATGRTTDEKGEPEERMWMTAFRSG